MMANGKCMMVGVCWLIDVGSYLPTVKQKQKKYKDIKDEEFTFEKAFEVDSRPQIYDDYEEEEEEDEYVDSDSEDDRPTHEIEAS